MKLHDFFAAIGPYLLGHASHAETVRALPGCGEVDAQRLAIYGRFARLHRFEVLDSLFPHLRRAILARGGREAWARLVETYFAHHPMRHFELNANGEHLPEFLQGHAETLGLPPWMPELADLEWWEWRTLIAPNDEAGSGPRLSNSVELRPYTYALVDWLDSPEEERAPEPEARECLVLFWRDPDFHARREEASPEELLVLKAVAEGLPLGDVAARSGASREVLEETFEDLSRAGILLD